MNENDNKNVENLLQNRLPIEFIPKGWGWESVIVNKDEYCGKLLFFKKGRQCSIHFHLKKVETFYIQYGNLRVELLPYEKWNEVDHLDFSELKKLWDAHSYTITMEEGDVLDIPRKTIHRMYGIKDSLMLEFSTRHYEDDSYRVQKGD